MTGANRGIGAAFAAALADECKTVYAGARDPRTVKAGPENVVPLKVDLSSRASIDGCFADERERIESVDVLVNNAGLLSVGLLEQQDLDRIYASLQVNLVGLIHLTKLVLPAMLARGEGYIVNNASMSGYAHFPLASVYAAGKSGVVAFSESLRRELSPTGVRVLHLVTPGVKTDMLAATEAGYGEHFDTSGWDQVSPAEWAGQMLKGIHNDSSVVWPGGKTRLATIAASGPSQLLDRAASRMFRR
ncbi:MAG: SDR family NAD(P)-dependent oxidoreductase [Thermoleophilia bacterium]|nr:SDR family NAD(P)-dependent oxidoreductase [Thermoleophilia bacterium]